MTEQELARGAARRLAIIRHAKEVTGNVARTCRYFGITRQAYYTWLRRYEEQVSVVTGIDDHSRFCVIAKVVPRATARPVAKFGGKG